MPMNINRWGQIAYCFQRYSELEDIPTQISRSAHRHKTCDGRDATCCEWDLCSILGKTPYLVKRPRRNLIVNFGLDFISSTTIWNAPVLILKAISLVTIESVLIFLIVKQRGMLESWSRTHFLKPVRLWIRRVHRDTAINVSATTAEAKLA